MSERETLEVMNNYGTIESDYSAAAGEFQPDWVQTVLPVTELLEEHEDWLMERILHYARKHGFAAYTSTLPEAWRTSIQGLSAAVIAGIHSGPDAVDIVSGHESKGDNPIVAFSVLEARKHRQRGISMSPFIGLLKYYRRCYTELVEQERDQLPCLSAAVKAITSIFDKMEVALIAEWNEGGPEKSLNELQQENRQLTNEKNKYLTLFDSLSDPAIFVNCDGIVENLNFAASQVTQVPLASGAMYYNRRKATEALHERYQPGDGIATGAAELHDIRLDDLFPGAAGTLNELASSASVDSVELTLPTHQGEQVFSVRSRKLHDVSKKFEGVVYLFHNITALRNVQADLEKANQELAMFNAAVSHDLRAPMRQMRAFSRFLGDAVSAGDEDMIQDLSHKIVDLGNHALDMIDDLSALNKASHAAMTREEIDMTRLAESVAERWAKSDICPQNIDLIVNRLQPCSADEGLIRSLLENLIGNACKYASRRQQPEIKVGCEPGNGEVVYYVKDNGIGFDPKHASEIFKPFCRLSNSGDFDGTGIGLATCKIIVERHGGTIWAEGCPDNGAVFKFTLGSGGPLQQVH